MKKLACEVFAIIFGIIILVIYIKKKKNNYIVYITFTNVVLLQPGGPYNKIPFAGFNPKR